MIEEPSDWHFFLILIPLFVGAGISLFLVFTMIGNVKLMFPSMFGGLTIFAILLFVWVLPEINEFGNQVMELINTTNCNDLPQLIDNYSNYKNHIVNEIVLRCLVDNPQLTVFVMENRN